MAVYEILITDVTNYSILYCVAGVAADGTMIRPEPHTANANSEASRFWSAADAGPGKFFSVGNVVSFEANAAPANFPYPHATEDRLVIAGCNRQIMKTVSYADMPQEAASSLSPALSDAFDGAVILPGSGKPYVPKNNQGRSLGAIEIASQQLQFHVNDYDPAKPKLRAYLTEGATTYNLPVTADNVNGSWKAQGMNALTAALAAYNRAHVRLGLSRPFAAQPINCYVQINGIFLFNA